MIEKKESSDNLIKGELCLPVRSKLESACGLDEREINHLQQCRECLAFFQLIEDGVLKCAYDKNLKLGRIAPVNNFAGRHCRHYHSRKTAFFFGNLSVFAVSLVLFIGLLWLISSSLQNGRFINGLNIGAREDIQDRSYALYSSYAEKVNTNYQRFYEDVAAEEYSRVYIFDGAEIVAEIEADDNNSGRDEEILYVLYQDSGAAQDSFFDGRQSDMLALNIAEEIDDYYAENIRELNDAGATVY
jgi:hypothetical protein